MIREYSVNEIEALNRAHSDEFARQKAWEGYGLQVPEEDLNLFFGRLPGKRVLDGGCGWGWYVDRFLRQGLEYIGVDLSPEMIRLAQEANPTALFSVTSMRRMQFPSASFDGIWCSCSLTYEPKRSIDEVMAELKRVLAASGVITIVMPAYDPEDRIRMVEGEVPFWRAHYELEEFKDVVKRAGFTILNSGYRFKSGAFSVHAQK